MDRQNLISRSTANGSVQQRGCVVRWAVLSVDAIVCAVTLLFEDTVVDKSTAYMQVHNTAHDRSACQSYRDQLRIGSYEQVRGCCSLVGGSRCLLVECLRQMEQARRCSTSRRTAHLARMIASEVASMMATHRRAVVVLG